MVEPTVRVYGSWHSVWHNVTQCAILISLLSPSLLSSLVLSRPLCPLRFVLQVEQSSGGRVPKVGDGVDV